VKLPTGWERFGCVKIHGGTCWMSEFTCSALWEVSSIRKFYLFACFCPLLVPRLSISELGRSMYGSSRKRNIKNMFTLCFWVLNSISSGDLLITLRPPEFFRHVRIMG
jgi:hypothetical protein